MKTRMMMLAAVVVGVAVSPLTAGSSVSGKYVEARTAEVFTGGCIMSSEAETIGKQAVLAWKVDRGSYKGVALDGLSVIAAVAGDKNLGIHEIGGDKAHVRSALLVDDRANAAQRMALVAMASELSNGVVSNIVNVTPTAIQFTDQEHAVHVAGGPGSGVALDVNKHMTHDPTCGAMQWFHPFVPTASAEMGIAEQHIYSGSSLGTKWSDPNKRSAFFGTFSD
jgi:hypothetical protein